MINDDDNPKIIDGSSDIGYDLPEVGSNVDGEDIGLGSDSASAEVEYADLESDLSHSDSDLDKKTHTSPPKNPKGFQPGNQDWKRRAKSGRDKKMQSLSTYIKRALEKGETKKKIADGIVQLAMDGNLQALKLLMERTEGLVSQKVEISGPNGEALLPAVLVLPSNGSEVMPALPPQYIDAEFEDDDDTQENHDESHEEE